jgi:hypothetical protein
LTGVCQSKSRERRWKSVVNAAGTVHRITTLEPGRIGLFYFEGKKESHYLNNTSGQPNPVWQLRGPL